MLALLLSPSLPSLLPSLSFRVHALCARGPPQPSPPPPSLGETEGRPMDQAGGERQDRCVPRPSSSLPLSPSFSLSLPSSLPSSPSLSSDRETERERENGVVCGAAPALATLEKVRCPITLNNVRRKKREERTE
eukprot:scaffold46777_cov32-Tisochrysis_lutea.AAC.1